MNTATQATIIILLTTVILPLGSGSTLSFVLNRFQARQGVKQVSSLIALTFSLFVSFIGILSLGQLWGADSIRYLFWVPLLVSLFWELGSFFLKAKVGQRLTKLVASSFGIVSLTLTVYVLSAPLKGLWRDGINQALLNEFLIPSIGLALLALNFNLKSIDQADEVKPAQFASLAITFGLAAPVVGLSGSASLAQLLAAFGLSIAGVGLMALWQGLYLSKSSYLSAYFTLIATLMYAHLYLSPALSPSIFTLLILAPSCGAWGAQLSLSPIKVTLVAIALSLPLSMIALGSVAYQELNKVVDSQEVDEFGASY